MISSVCLDGQHSACTLGDCKCKCHTTYPSQMEGSFEVERPPFGGAPSLAFLEDDEKLVWAATYGAHFMYSGKSFESARVADSAAIKLRELSMPKREDYR